MVCEKLDFAFLSLGGPNHGAQVWCLGRVPKHRNQWQEVEGLLFSPQNSQLVHILSFHSKAAVSLFIFPTGPTALDFEPRGRRYVKNMGHNRNHLYLMPPKPFLVLSQRTCPIHYFSLKLMFWVVPCHFVAALDTLQKLVSRCI